MAFLLPIAGAFLSSGGFTTAFGWAVASIVAGEAFKKKTTVEGARLSDLSVQTSEPGQTIPFIFGTVRIAGNIIWSTRIKEHVKSEEQGGKGHSGTTVNTYSYTWSGAILFCEESDQILGIWANEKKIYDYNGGTQKGYTLTHNGTTGAWTSSHLRVYTGTQTQLPDALIEADKGVGNTPAYTGRTYVVFEDFALADYGNTLPTFTVLVRRNITALDDIVKSIAAKVEITEEQMDLTALESYNVSGFVASDRAEARAYLDYFQKAFSCRFIEYDFKLRARTLVALSSILDISPDEIDFIDDMAQETQRMQSTSAMPLEIAYRVELEYIDSGRDYTRNMQQYTRQVVQSRKKDSISLPMVLNGAQAKQIVQTDCVVRWTERRAYKFSLGFSHLHLIPGDVISVPTLGGLVDVRIEKILKQFFGPVIVDAVQHDALAYSQPLGSNDPDLNDGGVPDFGEPFYVASDCHCFRDNDTSSYGFYFGMGVPSTMGWIGGSLMSNSIDQGLFGKTIFGGTTGISIPSQSVVGVTTNELGSASPFVLDTVNSLTVDISGGKNGGSLTSTTLEVAESGTTNALLVGKEIIQFLTATFVGLQDSGAKRYTLTNLLRGRLGTEVYIEEHSTVEKIMLLNATVARIPVKKNTLGIEQPYVIYYGNNILGSSSASSLNITVESDGWSLKPYAVSGLSCHGIGGGTTRFRWFRRTRQLDTFFATGIPVDNDGEEDQMLFDVEIASADGATVLRMTHRVALEHFDYTSAMKTADGVSNGDDVTVRVWQNSRITTPASPLQDDGELPQGYKAEVVLTLE